MEGLVNLGRGMEPSTIDGPHVCRRAPLNIAPLSDKKDKVFGVDQRQRDAPCTRLKFLASL